MPTAAPRPCTHPGCGRLVHDGTSRCSAHPTERTFADRTRGTRHDRGYGSEWDKRRKRVMYRDAGLCQPCLRESDDLVTAAYAVDHIVSKAEARHRGWTDEQIEDDSNLQAICRRCHDAKTADEARRGRGVGSSPPWAQDRVVSRLRVAGK